MDNTIYCCTVKIYMALLGIQCPSSVSVFPLLLLDRAVLNFDFFLLVVTWKQNSADGAEALLSLQLDGLLIWGSPLAIQTRFHHSFYLDYLCFVTELGLRHPTYLLAQHACGKETQRMRVPGSWLYLL